MIKKYIVASAIVFLFFSCTPVKEASGDTPEHIFNMANEAMSKGDDAMAIELFYKLDQQNSGLNKYRSDLVFRLGTLLYKTERYDEAEKALGRFVSRYPDSPDVKKALEMLLYIYMQELHDEARAQKIRDVYAKKFGDSPTLKQIDKTKTVVFSDAQEASALLSLDASAIALTGGAQKSDSFDKEFFPVRNYVLKSVKSPDGKYTAEKVKKSGGYYISMSSSDGSIKGLKVENSSGGYSPQWSWDDRYLLFTAMNWNGNERRIKIYDLAKKSTRELFKAPGVEPLVCISPDGSKIVFSYNGKLWIMNRDGNNISLLSKTVDAKQLWMIAWSREGGSLLFSKKDDRNAFYTCRLGRREIEAIK
jgi:tetratricopeptide (TPR) repeat protein